MYSRLRSLFYSHVSTIKALFFTALLIWIGVRWVQTIQQIAHFYVPLPVWDYWDTVAHVPSYHRFDLRVLWQQHNEHRILFPEILIALDYLVLHGHQVLPTVFSFLCYFGAWIVMAWALLQDRVSQRFAFFMAIATSGLIVSWRGSALALGIPFLLQWSIVEFASVAALACLALYRATARRSYFWALIAAAAIATYSSANGLLLWPVLLLAAFVVRFVKQDLLTLLTAACFFGGLFFIGYGRVSSVGESGVILHPLYLLNFIATYVSLPFGVSHYGTFGGAMSGLRIGYCNLALLATVTFLAWRKQLLRSTPAVVLLGISYFTLLSASVTALGRANPADPWYIAATASRYFTMPLLNWGALAMLSVWLASKVPMRSIGVLVVAGVCSVVAVRNLSRLESGSWVGNYVDLFANQQWAALAVENGISDPGANGILYGDPGTVDRLLPVLRKYRLSIFALPNQVGERLNLGLVRSVAESGEVTSTVPVKDGVQVVGWTDFVTNRRPDVQLVFADASNRIIGIGRHLPAAFPPGLRSPTIPSSLAWVGFVNSGFRAQSFSTYLLDRRGALIPIGSVTAVPTIQIALPTDEGVLVPGFQWSASPAWVENLLPPKINPGTPPVGGFLSSWKGSDTNTGFLSSAAFPAPPGNCLIWPVLHGPSAAGLSAELLDADSRDVLQRVVLLDGSAKWSYFKMPVPATVKRLQLKAEDEGKNWGEWVAVGNPAECREK